MKRHAATAVIALLASTLAMGGCGDDTVSSVESTEPARTLGYGNYLPGSLRTPSE